MSEETKHSKKDIVISSNRELAVRRAALVCRGLELIRDLEDRWITVSDKSKLKCLVVDDDDKLVEVLSQFLSHSCGYDSHGIKFGSETSEQKLMKLVRGEKFDILILDIMMPWMNGLELTRNIRSEGLNIPIILTTGFSIPMRAIESMRSGADDLIIKPFRLEELTKSIDAVYNQKNLQMTNHVRNQRSYAGIKFGDATHLKNSDLHGLVREYYETGQLRAELSYRNGNLDGISKVYRKWGTILAEVSFDNGVADGVTRWFSVDGQVSHVQYYENGELSRRKIYDNTGKTQQDIPYK